jgi:hypothetical protein
MHRQSTTNNFLINLQGRQNQEVRGVPHRQAPLLSDGGNLKWRLQTSCEENCFAAVDE